MKKPEWIRGEALHTVLSLNVLQPGDEVLYHEIEEEPTKTKKLKKIGCEFGESCLGTDVNGLHTFRRWVIAWRRPLK